MDLTVEGTLVADGTAAEPIVFTSIEDDSVGGDTGGNGPSSGNFGQWNTIRFQPGSTGNVLDNVQVRFGGAVSGFGSPAAVLVDQAELSMTNSVVRASDTHGVRIVSANPTLTGVTFDTNLGAAVSMNLASNPAISGVTMTNNAANALVVDSGVLTRNRFWNDPEIVYRLSGDVAVAAGATLTIAPGQVVKARAFAGDDILVNATLVADGTPGQPIIFTSDTDDSAGGDTNNNGASAGNSGHWSGLRFRPGSTGSMLDNVQVRFGGSAGFGLPASVIVDQAELTLTDSVVRSSDTAGIRIISANPTISGVTFETSLGAAASMNLASNPAISGVTVTGNGANALVLDAGTITADTIWNDPAIVYRLSGDVTVAAGATLTIEPGQIVKARAFAGDDILVNGTLVADGMPAQPIIFTADTDDSAGGDTNNNGASSGNFGHWNGLRFQPGSTGSMLDYVDVRFGGSFSFVPGAVVVDQAELTMTNSFVRSSDNPGVRIVSSNPTLIGVTFDSNLRAAVSMDLVSDATILSPAFTGNGVNGLALDSGDLPADITWDDPEIVYWLAGSVVVPAGRTLTIAPGQIMKGSFLGSGLFVDGVLLAQGTADQPIIGTSRDDDTAGGDTNNNGPVSIGLEDWAGIEIRAGSTGSVLDHVDLRYLDGFPGSGGAVRVVNGQATLTNSKIRNCAGFGVAARTTGQLTMTNTQISGCGDSAILAESGGMVTATNNTIDGSSRGVLVRTGSTANLTNNLITNYTNIGVHAENSAVVTAAFNDVFSAGGTRYLGLADQTGTNGNVSVDPRYFNRASRQFQLTSGSPVIDSGTSNGAPATDMLGNTRFDDPNVANRGAGAMPFVDLGAFERQEISDSDVDLVTFGVTGPATGSINQVVTVNWMVRNAGTGPAIAPWSDAIYLSSEPAFTPAAKFLGRVTHSSDLGAGDSYAASANVTLSNVLPGRNYFIVRTNDLDQVFEGIALGNNASASASAIDFAVTTLNVGTPLGDARSDADFPTRPICGP